VDLEEISPQSRSKLPIYHVVSRKPRGPLVVEEWFVSGVDYKLTGRFLLGVGLALLFSSTQTDAERSVEAEAVEERIAEQVMPSVEDRLRKDLRKLSRSGVSQLLRWEFEVDREQKRRANSSSNPRELVKLADDEDTGVRFFVAANRNTPLGTRLALAADREPAVRSGVAISLAYDPLATVDRRRLSQMIAARLAADENVLVRLSLVTNERLPTESYETLARDSDYVVRQKVAENPAAARAALVKLAQDTVLTVQTAAFLHKNMPPDQLAMAAGDGNPMVRLAISQNLNTPVVSLDSLANDTLPIIREMAARHPNTSLISLHNLATDNDASVVLAVVEHPTANRDILTTLAYSSTEGSIRALAQKRLEPILREEIREDIMERWKTATP